MRYLWRAVDHEGEVLESYVTKTRDKAAALAFLRRAMKRHGQPPWLSGGRSWARARPGWGWLPPTGNELPLD